MKGSEVAEALIEFARRQGVAHFIFGQSARARWKIPLRGSVSNRFLAEVRAAPAPVVPLAEPETAAAGH